MRKISLFGSSLQALSATSSAQQRLNVFYDLHPDGDKSNVIVRGTPGLTVFCTLPQSPIRAMLPVGNYLYVVADNGLYQVGATGNFTLLSYFGSAGQSSPCQMASNPTQLIIVDGTNGGWLYLFSNLINVITVTIATLQLQLIDISTIATRAGSIVPHTGPAPRPVLVPKTPVPRFNGGGGRKGGPLP